MRRSWWLLGLLLGLLTAMPAADAGPDDAQVAWLKTHAVTVRTHDPADEAYRDLQPLKKLWKDVRIVQLGEESHGDGACFLAKTRLIKFLHKEMGFDVLAFESGLYDCAKAWEALTAPPGGKFDPVDAMKQGVFGIWMQSHEVKPLANYLHGAANGPKPLELCGYDCQLTGRASGASLANELHAVASKAVVALRPAARADLWRRLVAYLSDQKAKLTIAAYDALVRDLARVAAALDGEDKIDGFEARARAWWAQVCRSLLAQLEATWTRRTKSPLGGPEASNPRDAQMAQNLIWLADEHYKGRKIIVWAATFHLIRNAPRLTPLNGRFSYKKTVPMGHIVDQHFGKACYTLGFSAYEGEVGRPWTDPHPLQRAAAGSFEDWMMRAGHTEAFVDLRAPGEGGAFLREPFVARPLGYNAMRGSCWHDTLDGLYFQRVMTPSTRNGYTPPPAVQDMTPLLDKTWGNIQSGLRGGNMWASKWTLEEAFTQWQRHARPTHAQIEAQEQVVEAWRAAQEKAGPLDGLAWRMQLVLADMAKARDASDEEVARLLAAMDAFSTKPLAQPMKTSKYQHMANRYAWLLMDRESASKAIQWLTNRLASERRFHVAYWQDWESRVSAKDLAKLKKGLRKAYSKRKKRFKDLKGEIAGFEAGLR